MATTAVELHNVGKTFSNTSGALTEALGEITLSVTAGEIVCVVGKSGCGKSTLLNLIGGSLAPDTGSVKVFGSNPTSARSKIGYMRQQAQLIPYRTALQNAALGLELRGPVTTPERDKATEFLREVGLGSFLSAFPHELSGGMQHRVALARTLALDVPLVLCDEPFAALDFDTRIEMEEFFWKLMRRDSRTSVFVTHDIESAIALGDRIITLTSRPGRIAKEIILPVELRKKSPIEARESDDMADYFKEIWELLKARKK